LQRISLNDLGAVKLQDSFAFGAGIGRQAKSHAISTGRSQHGIRNPGVPAGRIENYLSGMKPAAALTIENHRERGAILDRTSGIQVLGFHKDGNSIRQVSSDSTQAQERSVANLRFDIGRPGDWRLISASIIINQTKPAANHRNSRPA
jgi:hypothetical protein